MALEARNRTLGRPEAKRLFRIRDVVDLMTPGFEQQAVHDPRHVAGLAPAAVRSGAMMRVPLDTFPAGGVALQAHFVRSRSEFE
jgi:hypothetical protein